MWESGKGEAFSKGVGCPPSFPYFKAALFVQDFSAMPFLRSGQIVVVAQAVALAVDGEEVRFVEEAVEDGGGGHLVVGEDVDPVDLPPFIVPHAMLGLEA